MVDNLIWFLYTASNKQLGIIIIIDIVLLFILLLSFLPRKRTVRGGEGTVITKDRY